MAGRAPWFIGKKAAHRTIPAHRSSSESINSPEEESFEESCAPPFPGKAGPSAPEQRKIWNNVYNNKEEDFVVPQTDADTITGKIIHISSSESEEDDSRGSSSSSDLSLSVSSDEKLTNSHESKHKKKTESSSKVISSLAVSKARKRRLQLRVQDYLKKRKINNPPKDSVSEPSSLHFLGQQMNQSQDGCINHQWSSASAPGTRFNLLAWRNAVPAPEPEHNQLKLVPVTGYVGTVPRPLIQTACAFVVPWSSWLFVLLPEGYHLFDFEDLYHTFPRTSRPMYISRTLRQERQPLTSEAAQVENPLEYIVEEPEDDTINGSLMMSTAEETPNGHTVQSSVHELDAHLDEEEFHPLEENYEDLNAHIEDEDLAPLEENEEAPLEADPNVAGPLDAEVEPAAPMEHDLTAQFNHEMNSLREYVQGEFASIKEALFKIIDRLP